MHLSFHHVKITIKYPSILGLNEYLVPTNEKEEKVATDQLGDFKQTTQSALSINVPREFKNMSSCDLNCDIC